jgi:hypothetical protein
MGDFLKSKKYQATKGSRFCFTNPSKMGENAQKKHSHHARRTKNHVRQRPLLLTRLSQNHLLASFGLEQFAVQLHHQLFDHAHIFQKRVQLHQTDQFNSVHEYQFSQHFQICVNVKETHCLEGGVSNREQIYGKQRVQSVPVGFVVFVALRPQPHQS